MRKTVSVFVGFVLALGAFAAPAGAAAAEACPNEAIRVLQSAPPSALCRAYEQLTPVEKGQGRVRAEAIAFGVADGSRIFYTISGVFPGIPSPSAPKSARYAAVRGNDGWTNYSLQTPSEQPPSPGNPTLTQTAIGEADDGSRALVGSNLALAPGAVDGNANLYIRDVVGGGYTTVLSSTAEGAGATTLDGLEKLSGATPDFSKIVFSAIGVLTPEAAGGFSRNTYQWTPGGGIELVSIVPNEAEPGQPPIAGGSAPPGSDSVSPDGHRIAFESASEGINHGVWLHEDGRPQPIPVSASKLPGAPAGARPANLVKLLPDGGTVLFTASNAEPLTSGVPAEGTTLYSYDVASRELTPLLSEPDTFSVSHVSDDGAYIYLSAFAEFAEGAQPATLNEYLLHGGLLTFVHASALDPVNHTGESPTEAISPNGKYLVFTSLGQPTGYDNRTSTGRCPAPYGALGFDGLCREVYLYEAEAEGEQVRCLSCGSPAEEALGNAGIGTETGNRTQSVHFPRVVFDDGTVFFDSTQSLVPGDSNGASDVYEYRDGETALISRGSRDAASRLAEVSADQRSVFFTSNDPIVAQDTDRIDDLYVARAGGGIASQNVRPTASGQCSAAACPPSGAAAPAVRPSGSERTGGPGNIHPRRRCVRHDHGHGKRGAKARPARCAKRHSGKRGHDRGRAREGGSERRAGA